MNPSSVIGLHEYRRLLAESSEMLRSLTDESDGKSDLAAVDTDASLSTLENIFDNLEEAVVILNQP